MANWDEDTITMAVEAGRDALKRASSEQATSLTLASTTPPFADCLNAAIVSSALGLSSQIHAMDVGGSLRSGTSALLRALRSGGTQSSIIIASERRIPTPASTGELLVGDGAAAIVVGSGNPIAVLKGSATEAANFVDHFRETGRNGDYGWEERWVREEGYAKLVPPVILRALEDAGCRADEIDHFVMPSALLRANQAVAKKVGIRPEAVADTLFEVCGDTGTAHPLLMLANVLSTRKAQQKILLVQFGSGCDALVIETLDDHSTTDVLGLQPGVPEANYMKYLSFTGQVNLEWGMRSEMDNKTALTAAWRSETMVHGFVAGRCTQCGTVQFPSSRLCVNPNCCAQDTQEPYRLADEPARIRSFTCDWLSYKPCPPFLFGHVEFDSGARVLMEFTDSDPNALSVGTPLEMTFRIKDVDPQRGYRRYFWKAKAVQQNGGH
jgi:3-hydroxy-3-methylglutaryl CoA synthase